MEFIEGLVWCEAMGDTHSEGVEDPEQWGPVYVTEFRESNPGAWVKRTNYKDWPGTLMFYVCPGPHFKVWRGAAI